jgi:ribonuclease VapC
LIVVDASAICAILFDEPERGAMRAAMADADRSLISPVNAWEVAVALARRSDKNATGTLTSLFAITGTTVTDITALEGQTAFAAWRTYGKGRHPAGLNLGDCFAYALAKSRDLPLLYKGRDFDQTDLRPALARN